MKRFLSILLLCCMAAGLAACGSGREAETGTAEASAPPEVWHGRLTGAYPLGVAGKITIKAKTGTHKHSKRFVGPVLFCRFQRFGRGLSLLRQPLDSAHERWDHLLFPADHPGQPGDPVLDLHTEGRGGH